MRPKLKRALQNISLAAGTLLTGLLLLEIGLRWAGFVPLRQELLDPDLGLVHRPNAEGWYRKEGNAFVRISSAGLRDEEHTKVKPRGVFRIAVLGDSYAEALQVPVEETFWWILGRKLEQCPSFAGRNVEVINFGVSGYSTAQELLMLRKRVWDYSPDLVLLAFLTGNDVRDNSRELSHDYPRPYFTLQNGKLILDGSFRDSPYYQSRTSPSRKRMESLKDRSVILQWASEAKSSYQAHMLARKQGGPVSAVPGQEIGMDDRIYLPPSDAAWWKAWRITEALLSTMHREVRRNGAQFMVVTLSNGIQVHPDPSVRESFTKWLGVKDLFYPERRIRALGSREGFSVLPLAPPLQSSAQKNQTYLHGFPNTAPGVGHWNQEGHRLAGERIAQNLCDEMKKGTLLTVRAKKAAGRR